MILIQYEYNMIIYIIYNIIIRREIIKCRISYFNKAALYKIYPGFKQ